MDTLKSLALFLLYLLFPVLLWAEEKVVLVSVAPYVQIVSDLVGPSVQVELLVPSGYSPHEYEPAPRQVLRAAKASCWFQIGEVFEEKITKSLTSQNPNMAIIDLRQGLSLLYESCHDIKAADPHIWMSPPMMKTQVRLMAVTLQRVFSDLREEIAKNEKLLVKKLDALDQECQQRLSGKKGYHVFVGHPAYGYFCREYGLVQEAIEFEGRDPTPKRITKLITLAKRLQVKEIFVQPQYSSKASELVAEQIGAKLVILQPYSAEYFESIRHIAFSFASGSVPDDQVS